MIPTYTAKRGRRFRYYVCRSARKSGWSACPTKSVPAPMIEESVLDQLLTAFDNLNTRNELRVSDSDLETFRQNPAELMRAVVKKISYFGKTGTVMLNLRMKEATCEN